MSTPALEDILNSILLAIKTIMFEVAEAIATNASAIATVVVLGALTFAVWRYGTRMFRGITGWLGKIV